MVDDLLGVAEIADLLGVTRQRAWQLSRHADFPVPAAVLTAGTIWWGKDVRAWMLQTGRSSRLTEDNDEP